MDKKISKNVAVNKSDIAIELENINFSYDDIRPTLTDINFQIEKNTYVCVIGHNGSGKSTISKILVGLLKPQFGKMFIFGNEISYSNIRYLRENIGIVFQNPDSQFIGMTAEDDIAFGLENKKVNPRYMKEIILDVAKIVDIKNFLPKDAISLSGGQKQRVAIASVLAMNPEIIIFDESTSMLDPRGKMELKEIMVKLKNESKKTIISITHDMDEVINADKVIVLEKGKVVKIGKPEEIFVDEEFLKNISLSLPFTLKLSKLLKSNGSKINLTVSKEKFVDDVCKIVK
ncbi:MAG: energy-coupling factor transporter ATPase [Malacoplasma sp.]|nr:energy-coupling factor transporter ATPase [Malacoplasma sp.]